MLCTINPTRFRFEMAFPLMPWVPKKAIEIEQCCCLEDGLRMLRHRGINPLNVVGVEFWVNDHWQRFQAQEIEEIRKIAIAQPIQQLQKAS